jgi:hypothetical protein
MEGLLVYEDTATIIASIYVEQDQSKRNHSNNPLIFIENH